MTIAIALENDQIKGNISKTKYTSEYRQFHNSDCQIRFTGDKLPSAKEVYFYLCSLPENWKILIKNVAAHFGTSKKYMQDIFKIIIKNDRMICLKMRAKTGKFLAPIYKVFQPNFTQPQSVTRPPAKPTSNQPDLQQKSVRSPEVASRPPATYYRQNKHTKETTAKNRAGEAPKEGAERAVVVALKELITSPLKSQFTFKTYRLLKDQNLSDGQIKTLLLELNARDDIQGFGWLINKCKYIEDKTTIVDFDVQEAQQKIQDAQAQKIYQEIQASNDAKTKTANQNAQLKSDKYIQAYLSLSDSKKLKILEYFKQKSVTTEKRDEIDSAGIDGLTEIIGFSFRCKPVLERYVPKDDNETK